MKVNKYLLNSENSAIINGISIAHRLISQQRQMLWSNRNNIFIDTIVLHYISAIDIQPDNPFDFEKIIEIFCNLCVSSHYLIDRNGELFLLVPEDKKAWHCGGSIMPPPDCRQGVNEFSIGIEMIATETSGFTDSQYVSCALLCSDIEKRWPVTIYTGHENIAGKEAVQLCLRTDIKTDPGNLFDWQRFFREKNQKKLC